MLRQLVQATRDPGLPEAMTPFAEERSIESTAVMCER